MRFWGLGSLGKNKRKKGKPILSRAVVEAKQKILLAFGFTLFMLYIVLQPVVTPACYSFVQVLAILPVLWAGLPLFNLGWRAFRQGLASLESLLTLSCLASLALSLQGTWQLASGLGYEEAAPVYYVVTGLLVSGYLYGKYVLAWAKVESLEPLDRPAAVLLSAGIVLAVMVGLSCAFTGVEQVDIGTLLAGILAVSSPLTLSLAKPLALAAGAQRCGKLGIVLKDAGILEKSELISLAIFDKTGTITEGKPVLDQVLTYNGAKARGILSLAVAMVTLSETTMLEMVALKNAGEGLELPACTDVQVTEDGWLTARSFHENVRLGSYEFVRHFAPMPAQTVQDLGPISDEGKMLLFLAVGRTLYAVFTLTDTLRKETVPAMEALKALQVRTVVMTGDNKRAGGYIAKQAQADQVVAELLPSHKAELVESFKLGGEVVAMVGDADNDAPAMAVGDLGIAVGSGTKAAWQAANVVLTNNDLRCVAELIKLSKACVRCASRNVYLACAGPLVLWPVATGLAGYLGYPLYLTPQLVLTVGGVSLALMLLNTLLMYLQTRT